MPQQHAQVALCVTDTSRHRLFRPIAPWPLRILAAGVAILFALVASGATVSGTVDIPKSDAGYQPSINNSYPSKVRVAGTGIETNVVATSSYTGVFTLTGVPTGPVTLLYVETPGEDSFTMASRRLTLNVVGDVGDAKFGLQHHWRFLPSYPPPYSLRASYDIWEPYWVSAKLGFMFFNNRGVSPQETELWRTTNGGTSWVKIGHWIMTAWTILPDITGRSMLFADANHGVIVARYTAPVGVFRTADGGGTWEFVALPKSDDGNGVVSAQNFARIDATHWIACGAENTGTYYGIGTPFRFTVWETADAGATWAIKRSWLEDYASCTAVDADKSGHALLFATPYAFGGGMHRELRSTGVPGAASPATTSSPTPGTARPMSPWWDPRSGFVRLSKVRPALGCSRAATTARPSRRSATYCRSTWTSLRRTRDLRLQAVRCTRPTMAA